MSEKFFCFIHSCNIKDKGTEILEHLLNTLTLSDGFMERVENIFINNVGIPIDNEKFGYMSKVVVINHSNDPNTFENPTIRLLYFFSRVYHESNVKILYLHTKGVSHDKVHPFYRNVRDWVDYMTFCLVERYDKCLKLLDYVDVIGCNYRDVKYDRSNNPSHFSGNFWWARSDYISRLTINQLSQKYDAEFWLFKGNPRFYNIHTCPYGHYENRYHRYQYENIVDNKLNMCLGYSGEKILYGVESNYTDITDKCLKSSKNGFITIPLGDHERNEAYSDPIPGVVKHIKIGDIILDHSNHLVLIL